MTTDVDDWEAPVWIDRTLPVDGESKSVTGREALMAAARMQRDGRSLRYIRKEMGLFPEIPDRIVQNALDLGHRLLAQSIAMGVEPEESRVLLDDTDDFTLFGPDGRPL